MPTHNSIKGTKICSFSWFDQTQTQICDRLYSQSEKKPKISKTSQTSTSPGDLLQIHLRLANIKLQRLPELHTCTPTATWWVVVATATGPYRTSESSPLTLTG
ncbi:hypothetical protein ILYODFUR_009958 [Ilyodon furcidens]|uniref:Uncharacterized protein n=1 Tax=Ilyodon furcidens TaxID=33524 RepID=A0ABV0VDA3_9TELE